MTGDVDVSELSDQIDRVPHGWTEVEYRHRRYGMSRSDHADGRSLSIVAEELGGSDLISTNVYRTARGDVLRPCEMPTETVLAFLAGWQLVQQ